MSILRPKRVGWETVNKASNGEQLFRRFFVAKKTATKKQLQSCRVLAALGITYA